MTEAKWTAALLRKLRARYPGAFIHKVNERISAGIPDAEFIVNGVALKIEFKGPKTPITPIQIATMNKLTAAGAHVLVVRFTGQGTGHMLLRWHTNGGALLGHDLFTHIELTCQR